jgi:hypothetical protein
MQDECLGDHDNLTRIEDSNPGSLVPKRSVVVQNRDIGY